MTRRFVTAACISAVVASLSACSGGDKAGGDRRADLAEPLVLTLAAYAQPEPDDLVAAVRRVSGGSLRIEATTLWRDGQPDYEVATIADVRRGDVDLAIVAARAFDLLGATSFHAVLAPFLVDSLELEGRVLESLLARRMLAGVEATGVMGLGVLPGALRRPVAIRLPAVTEGALDGAVVGVRPSAIVARTYRALGARTRIVNDSRELERVDATDATLTTLDFTHSDRYAQSVAADVALWPHVLVVIANRDSFVTLGPRRQAVLRRAVRDAFAPTLARVASNEASALAGVCARGTASLVAVSQADRVRLRRAVEPVYDELRRDALTRELMARIAQMRRTAPPDTIRCPERPRGAASVTGAVDGTWVWSVTPDELLAAGDTPAGSDRLAGRWRLVLRDGRFELSNADSGDVFTGDFRITGNRLVARLDGTAPTDPALQYSWSIFRGRLKLGPVAGTQAASQLVAKPLVRVS
jgi:TRAP-type C4-dicarboxylate transport system substrate-binding protein